MIKVLFECFRLLLSQNLVKFHLVSVDLPCEINSVIVLLNFANFGCK